MIHLCTAKGRDVYHNLNNDGSRLDDIVDLDYMFYRGLPAGLFTDGAIRFTLFVLTVGRNEEDCQNLN